MRTLFDHKLVLQNFHFQFSEPTFVPNIGDPKLRRPCTQFMKVFGDNECFRNMPGVPAGEPRAKNVSSRTCIVFATRFMKQYWEKKYLTCEIRCLSGN